MALEEINNWKDALFYVVTGILGFIIAHSKKIKVYILDKLENAGQSISEINKIYDLIWTLEAGVDVIDRVAILRAGNGGSKPTIGKPMKATMLYCSFDNVKRNKKQDYQNLDIDNTYIKMLSDMVVNGSVALRVSEDESSQLNDIYLSEGVWYSEVHYITDTRKYIYYVSYATAKKGEYFESADIKNALRNNLSALKNIFNNNIVD